MINTSADPQRTWTAYTMGYVNACFISYKRPPKKKHPPGTRPKRREKHHWLELAEIFQAKLEKFLDCEISSFRDEELDPGTYYRGRP